MIRDRLYLLKSDFMDHGKGPYFCPDCAQLLGLLEFDPALKQKLEMRFVDFPRPRPELLQLLGEQNQSCPVLVLKDPPSNLPESVPVQNANGQSFVEGVDENANYFAHVYGTGIPH